MSLIDFICEWLAEVMEGSEICCEYLTEVDDMCYETCDYISAQPQCWKRYFTGRFNKENENDKTDGTNRGEGKSFPGRAS